jgi:glycolate oxidase FAD binding subunit
VLAWRANEERRRRVLRVLRGPSAADFGNWTTTTVSDYRIHTLAPAATAAPRTPDELAATLREATADGRAAVPWGAGTRQHIGRPPARYDLAIVTTGLDRIAAYHPADLVVTVEAGVALAALQSELARHGQWLPWDAPQPGRATVGGLLASGATGPLRLGYGPPRDWTLGMAVALGDGRLVRSGGKVVKNVAGYDAHKLHIGALGTLGVIAEATFKVAPIPERRQTLLAAFTDPHLPARALELLRAAPLQPIALAALNRGGELATPPLHAFLAGQPTHIVVAARFAGAAGAVQRQIREAVRRCVQAGARTIELGEDDDAPLWAALAEFSAPAGDGSLLLRAGAPAPTVGAVAALLERTGLRAGWAPAQLAVAGVGLVFSRWATAGAAPAAVAAAVAAVRDELRPLGGYAVVEEAPAALAPALDIWGPPPDGATVMRSLRAAWDPAGILSPGRYVI